MVLYDSKTECTMEVDSEQPLLRTEGLLEVCESWPLGIRGQLGAGLISIRRLTFDKDNPD